VDHDLKALRTGRASTSMVEGVKAMAYGTETPISQLATISTPDASTIAIQPWDAGVIHAIEKGILQANIGLNPNNDGKVIRLNVPPLTQDSRKDLVKRAHAIAEEGRIAIRNVRRHVNDEIKANEKKLGLSEDDKKRQLEEVQKKTDLHIKKIEALLQSKEKEVMTV
jgi:ribosome recycling factor